MTIYTQRRQFILGAIAPLLRARSSVSPSLLMATRETVEAMKSMLSSDQRVLFRQLSDNALKAGPWSVTFHRPSLEKTQAGLHDYYSEGPYWWPDPARPKGPYIRRDGEHNPDRFIANHADLTNLCESTLALGLGAYFLDMRACADRANECLATWFVDAKTKMNANLEFGQAIPGVSTGRGTGLIDTVPLIHAAQGLLLLQAAGGIDSSVFDGVRRWYREFLQWMTGSRKA